MIAVEYGPRKVIEYSRRIAVWVAGVCKGVSIPANLSYHTDNATAGLLNPWFVPDTAQDNLLAHGAPRGL